MKAVFLERFGAPEVLVERQMHPLTAGPDEVRIDVMATGVNFADLLQRLGLYGSAPKLPYVPGFEVAGVVTGTGHDVTDLATGDRVVGLAELGAMRMKSVSLRRLSDPYPTA